MAAGKTEKALAILQNIAKENKTELPQGDLVATEKHEVGRGWVCFFVFSFLTWVSFVLLYRWQEEE